MSALLGSSSLCRRGPLVHTLSLFHPLEGEEEEREEGERPGERGHLLVHLGLGRRRWKCPSFLETLLCADRHFSTNARKYGHACIYTGDLDTLLPRYKRDGLEISVWCDFKGNFSDPFPRTNVCF